MWFQFENSQNVSKKRGMFPLVSSTLAFCWGGTKIFWNNLRQFHSFWIRERCWLLYNLLRIMKILVLLQKRIWKFIQKSNCNGIQKSNLLRSIVILVTCCLWVDFKNGLKFFILLKIDKYSPEKGTLWCSWQLSEIISTQYTGSLTGSTQNQDL